MKKLLLLFVFISLNTNALVYSGHDQEKNCDYLSVHYVDSETNTITPTLLEGSRKLGYTSIFGNPREYNELATKNLNIDFQNRRALINLELTVAFGANKLLPQKVFIQASNPNFTRLINTLNSKLINLSKDAIQYICYRNNGEIVDLRFALNEDYE